MRKKLAAFGLKQPPNILKKKPSLRIAFFEREKSVRKIYFACISAFKWTINTLMSAGETPEMREA